MATLKGFLVIDAATRRPLRFSRFRDPHKALVWAYAYIQDDRDFLIIDGAGKVIPGSLIRRTYEGNGRFRPGSVA